ncbi:MAG: SRPBCC family protein [Alphaproteobacteria bacterium]|nr:SRPBCC family protein [Alphaproteobacteria bacterium]
MAKVSVSQKIPASAQQVWDAIGQFNSIGDWHPGVQKSDSEDGGTVRRLTMPDGSTLVETLVSEDGKERTYEYAIPDGQMPFSGYRAKMRVIEDDDGNCTAFWESEFEPQSSDAEKLVNDIYQAGLDNIRKMFGG